MGVRVKQSLRDAAVIASVVVATAAASVVASLAFESGVPDLRAVAVVDVEVARAARTTERPATTDDVARAAGPALLDCRRFEQAFMTFGGSVYRLHLVVPRKSLDAATARLRGLVLVRVRPPLRAKQLDDPPYNFKGPLPCR
jgi:hypothetical protein